MLVPKISRLGKQNSQQKDKMAGHNSYTSKPLEEFVKREQSCRGTSPELSLEILICWPRILPPGFFKSHQ